MGLTEVVAGDSSNSGIKKVGSRVKGVYHSRGSSTASSSSDNSSLADDSSWVPAVSSLGYPNSTDPLSELALNPKTLEVLFLGKFSLICLFVFIEISFHFFGPQPFRRAGYVRYVQFSLFFCRTAR